MALFFISFIGEEVDSGTDRRRVKQLRWRRQNLNVMAQKRHGCFWNNLEMVEVPEEKYLKLFAQKMDAPKKQAVSNHDYHELRVYIVNKLG